MISKRAMIDWTTRRSYWEEVALAVYHPEKLRPTGVIENTDISPLCSRVNADKP